ncbi:MAG: RNA polymerase sigma factor [Gammaproteobacteria bacterium]
MNLVQPLPADSLPKTLDDHGLVAHALTGRHSAFEQLMRRYNQRLFRLARGIVKDDAEAEEVLQEGYLQAYLHLASYQGSGSLGGWLSKIVINEALGRLRRRRARPEYESLDDVADECVVLPFGQPTPAGPEESAISAELRWLIEAEIDRLPDAFRSVFVLCEVEQLSVRETAELLGLPEATVKTRNHRAKERLRLALNQRIETALGDTFRFLGARCDRITARVMERLRAAGMLYSRQPQASLAP